MKTLLLGFLALSTGLLAQAPIAPGTILPVQLNTSLSARKSRPGQIVTGRVMQDVPLPGSTIRAGSKVLGHVLGVESAARGGGAKVSLKFDTLKVSNRTVAIVTDLRALASMMEVEAAKLPTTGPDRGTSENSWNTQQIGGDIVYRGGGPVAHGQLVVGVPVANGVLVRVATHPGTKCRAAVSGNDRPQALWLFSADACGIYGFSDLTILHAGRSNPVGEITLGSDRNFVIRSGSGLLLRVQ